MELSRKYGGKVLKVHVKIDSGMGRLGIRCGDEVLHFMQRLQELMGFM